MTPTRTELLTQVCDLADTYLAIERNIAEVTDALFKRLAILGILIDLEHILDSGRTVTMDQDAGASMSEVNRRMDALRDEISELMKRIGEKEAMEYVDGRIRAVQREWPGWVRNATAS